jgi:septin family protein
LLNQYFAHGKAEQNKSEQLEAVLLSPNICDLVEQSIITQSENYRNDVFRVFYAALETESKRTESMRLVLEEHKTQHDAEKKYFSDARGLAAQEISILTEKILGLEGELEQHKSEIVGLQARIVESHNSFICLA